MQVHLWHTSFDPAEEMRIITTLSNEPETRVQHLSCYYSMQYLHMIFRNLDILSLGISSEKYPHEVYFRFMMQLGCDGVFVGSGYSRVTSARLGSIVCVINESALYVRRVSK